MHNSYPHIYSKTLQANELLKNSSVFYTFMYLYKCVKYRNIFLKPCLIYTIANPV